MRKSFLLIGGVAVLASLIGMGCHKGTDGVPQSALRAVFENNLAAAQQSFTVNAATGGNITGNDGTQVFFGPNAFRFQNGTAVTGVVTVQLVEALTVGDMLWLNKQSVGNDNGVQKPLTSGGQIRLTATQSGQELKLAPGGSFVVIPSSNPDPQMELFSGTVETDGTILWDPWGSGTINGDSLAYAFPNDSLGYINCDYFSNWGAPLTTIKATMPAGHDSQNSLVWVVFQSINSMTSLHEYDMNGPSLSTSSNYAAPIGMNVVVVSLALINGDYYSSFANTTLVANHNEVLTYQPTTLAQFQSDCQGL